MFKRRALLLGAVLSMAIAAVWLRPARGRPADAVVDLAAAPATAPPPDPFLDGWTPPSGIPAPEFGITERAPVAPADWR